jgi:hypothetical protein
MQNSFLIRQAAQKPRSCASGCTKIRFGIAMQNSFLIRQAALKTKIMCVRLHQNSFWNSDAKFVFDTSGCTKNQQRPI